MNDIDIGFWKWLLSFIIVTAIVIISGLIGFFPVIFVAKALLAGSDFHPFLGIISFAWVIVSFIIGMLLIYAMWKITGLFSTFMELWFRE